MVEGRLNPEVAAFGKVWTQAGQTSWDIDIRLHCRSSTVGCLSTDGAELRPAHDPILTFGFVCSRLPERPFVLELDVVPTGEDAGRRNGHFAS